MAVYPGRLQVITGLCGLLLFIAVSCQKKPSLELRLPLPVKAREIAYLGIDSTFDVAGIDAQVVIIEFFSMHCAQCQRDAPKVNEFYKLLNSSGYEDIFKLIGVGSMNRKFDVTTFRMQHKVKFPLFPDPDGTITKALGVTETPTFVAVKINEDKTVQKIRALDDISDATDFLHSVVSVCRLKDGKCTWEGE